MTEDEALKVVGYFNAAYPTNKLDDSSAAVFCQGIAPLDFKAARAAVLTWIRGQKWFPSIAEFTWLVHSQPKEEQKALPEPVASQDYAHQKLEEIRQILANAKGPLTFNLRGSTDAASRRGSGPRGDRP